MTWRLGGGRPWHPRSWRSWAGGRDGKAPGSLGQREREPEGRALAHRAVNAHLSTMGLDETLAEIQTDAQSHSRASPHLDLLGLIIQIPDERLLASGYAATQVVYGDAGYLALHLQNHLD